MRLRLARRHSWHHHPSSDNAEATNDSLRSTGTTTSTSKYRRSFFFRSPTAAITSDDDSTSGSMTAQPPLPPTRPFRQVRFDIGKATIHHDSPYTQDCIEELWFNHDELKGMKLDCAREIAAIWKETPKEDFARVLEDCTSIEFEEVPVTSIQNERLAMLGRILGVAQYCCSATRGLSRAERQRAVVTAVQRAQQRSRETNYLCLGFLISRASEQISLPCQRLAHWMAMAAVAREDE